METTIEMKTKRTLLSQKNETLNEMISDVRYFEPAMKAVQATYAALELGPFTLEVFEEVKKGPGSIVARLRDTLESQITGAGLGHSALRKTFSDHNEPLITAFQQSVDELLSFRLPSHLSRSHQLTLKYISFSESKGFYISEENKELILETYCRQYAENETETAINDTLAKFRDAYVEMEKGLKSAGALKLLKPEHRYFIALEFILKIDGEEIIVHPDAVKIVSRTEQLNAYRRI